MGKQRLIGLWLLLFLAATSGVVGPTGVSAQSKPEIVLSPASGPGGTAIAVSGANFMAGDTVSIEIVGNLENRPLTTAAVGQDGRFVATAALPVGGLYPDHVTLVAFPLSLPDRSAASLAQAPTAIFTVTQTPAGTPQLPQTGTGGVMSPYHAATGHAVAGLVFIGDVVAAIGAAYGRAGGRRY